MCLAWSFASSGRAFGFCVNRVRARKGSCPFAGRRNCSASHWLIPSLALSSRYLWRAYFQLLFLTLTIKYSTESSALTTPVPLFNLCKFTTSLSSLISQKKALIKTNSTVKRFVRLTIIHLGSSIKRRPTSWGRFRDPPCTCIITSIVKELL